MEEGFLRVERKANPSSLILQEIVGPLEREFVAYEGDVIEEGDIEKKVEEVAEMEEKRMKNEGKEEGS